MNTINRQVYVYDIETIAGLFTYIGYNIDTKEVVKFILHKDRNDLPELMSHLIECKGQIGFNSLDFDYPIIHYIMINMKKWLDKLSNQEIIDLIYAKAQWIINTQKETTGKKVYVSIKEKDVLIPQLDLFKVWHFDNAARRTSLKWIQYSIDYPNIEEMSIEHSKLDISEEEIISILGYNLNDVMSTYEFYKITIGETEHSLYKGIDKIQLRKDIISEFNIKCINYNDVKIGDWINKVTYSKLCGVDIYDLPKKGTFRKSIKIKDCIRLPIEFESLELQAFYKDFTSLEFSPIKDKDDDTKYNRKFVFRGLEISFGLGGIHSVDKPRLIVSDNDYYLTDKDCTGMYPRTIIEQGLYPAHLGPNWNEGCKYVYYKRANEYKPLAKKDKKAQSFSEAFKLASNGGSFGMTNQVHSWQYDPLVTFSITIFNQFALLKFAEMLILNGIKVVSLNTDGCLSYVGMHQKETYERLSKEWEALSRHDLEETLYSKFIQTSVNDYIAVTTDGKIKKKGDFLTEFELNKNKSARVVPLALEQYFINGVQPSKFIKEYSNIFDFCLGAKSIGSNRLITLNKQTQEEVQLQKINRYYISNTGVHLLKRLPPLSSKKPKNQLDIFGNIDDGTRESEIEAGWLSTIYNKHEQKPINQYNINYKYYIEKCNKIINKII